MNRSRIITLAVVITAVLVWIFSGILGRPDPAPLLSLVEAQERRQIQYADRPPMSVRAVKSVASMRDRTITLRGRLIDRNKATVPSRTADQVISRAVNIGEKVEKGDVLCELRVADRQARVDVARDALEVAQKEHEGAVKLAETDFIQQLQIARAAAQLSNSEHQLIASKLEFENTKILAPVDGVVDEVYVNVGDFIGHGMPCASILVLDPLYVQAFIGEDLVNKLTIGSKADVSVAGGETRTGQLTYISSKADAQTRTFRIEATIPNHDYSIRSGLSASVKLILGSDMAHKVPVSVLLLDQEGSLGVKTINDQSRVEIHNVDIVREDPDGVWVAGLPSISTVITVGQGLVGRNDPVTPEFD